MLGVNTMIKPDFVVTTGFRSNGRFVTCDYEEAATQDNVANSLQKIMQRRLAKGTLDEGDFFIVTRWNTFTENKL